MSGQCSRETDDNQDRNSNSMKESSPTLSAPTTKRARFKPTHDDIVKAVTVVANPEFNWVGTKGSKCKLLAAATDHLRKDIPDITECGLHRMILNAVEDYKKWSESGENGDFALIECRDSLEILNKSSININKQCMERKRKIEAREQEKLRVEALEREKLKVKSEKLALKRRKLDLKEKIFLTFASLDQQTSN